MAQKCIGKGGTQKRTHCHDVNLFIKQVIKNKRRFSSCCYQKFEKASFAEFTEFIEFAEFTLSLSLLSFLDIKIIRQNQQSKTPVYRKPTFSGAFMYYESHLDQIYKNSLIDTLLFRCFSISSDYTLFHWEVKSLRKILKKNSYLSGIIKQSIKYFLSKLDVPKKVIPTVPKIQFKAKITSLL